MNIGELFVGLFLMWVFVLAFLIFLNANINELKDELRRKTTETEE